MITLGKINEVLKDHMKVLDSANQRRPGIPVSEFKYSLRDPDGVERSAQLGGDITVNFIEFSYGNYRLWYTPDKVGAWYIDVWHPTIFPWGQHNDHQIYSQSLDDVGPGTGDHMQKVIVKEAVTDLPLQNTRVRVYNDAMTQLVAQGYTNSLGEIELYLNDGDYKVNLYRLGTHTFTNPHDLTVVAPYTDVTYYGTPITLPSPTSPEGCMVYGWLTELDGVTPMEAEVTIEIVGGKQFTSGGLQVPRSQTVVTSRDTDGYWQVELVRSSEFTDPLTRYAFKVDGIAQCEFIVPDVDNINFANMDENIVTP